MKKNVLSVTEPAVWDVIVIGGGPAGMMAAIEAGRRGLAVLLLEKNPGLGKKLLITGGGRCNVTNNKPIVRQMLSQYQDAGKFLFSTFMQHGVQETIAWLNSLKVELKEENEGRLFPVSNTAQTICSALVAELETLQIQVQTKSKVVIMTKLAAQFIITLERGEELIASKVVVATGGTARPETGSTGDAYPWLAHLGHTVQASRTSLVPVTVREGWVKTLGGVSLPETTITVYGNGKKKITATGKLLFTHVGLSGPLILNQSKTIGDLLVEGEVVIKIDLVPAIDAGLIQAELLKTFQATPNKKIKNVLSGLIKTALVSPVLALLKIDGETAVHSLSGADRKKIGVLLKALPMTVSGLLGASQAIATAGGVDLREVDFKTMESKLVSGLYLVGDILDINRPSGGYSLQLCWSTGFVAGKHI